MSAKSTGQSIVKGSMILLIANFTVKLIGAIFKIPLTNLLGNTGMGYFNAAYSIYAGLFVIATAGLPVAVSKMVSESVVTGNLKETKKIYNAAFMMFLVIGIAGSLVLYFFADSLAQTTEYLESNLAIRTIAPAILFVSMMSVYRGFFQGMSNMFPTAISEVVEALTKLVVGYLLAWLLISKGLPVAASGAVFGVTTGTFLGFVVLMLIHQKKKKAIYAGIELAKPARPMASIVKELFKIAVPVTISASVFTLTNMVDYVLIGQNLNHIKEFLVEEPIALYGKYTAKAVVLYNMPPTLVMSLCMALVPAVARAMAVRDKQLVRTTTTQSLKITLLFSLPCAVGLGTLADPILRLLYGTNDAGMLLQLVSAAVIFVSLVLVTNSILQATGHVIIPVINIAVAGVAKVIINIVLVSNPAVNINGAPIGTAACYFIYMALNLLYVKKITNADISFSFWLKPILSAAVMGVVAYFLNLILFPTFGDGRFGSAVILVLAGGVSCVAYLLSLLVSGGISREDLSILPKGEKVAHLLIKMKLMK